MKFKIQILRLTNNDSTGCGYREFLKCYSPIGTFTSAVNQLLMLLLGCLLNFEDFNTKRGEQEEKRIFVNKIKKKKIK